MYNCIVSDSPILTVSLKTKLNPPLYWALGSSHDHTIKIKEIFTPVALPKDIGSIVFNAFYCGSLCALRFSFGKGISLMAFSCLVMVLIKESICQAETCGV